MMLFFLCQFGIFQLLGAELLKFTGLTVRFPRCADVAPVQQQPVMGIGDILVGDEFDQCLLHLQRCVVAL